MATEGNRRNDPGLVNNDASRYAANERLVRLEEKMNASREDRLKLHERLDDVEKNISEQIKVQTERTAYMDILKWVAALVITAVGGYFFAVLTQHVEHNAAQIEQTQHQLGKP